MGICDEVRVVGAVPALTRKTTIDGLHRSKHANCTNKVAVGGLSKCALVDRHNAAEPRPREREAARQRSGEASLFQQDSSNVTFRQHVWGWWMNTEHVPLRVHNVHQIVNKEDTRLPAR